MTLPDERYRALIYSREFMRDLLDPKKTPGVPKLVRQRAYRCLKHYPNKWEYKILGLDLSTVENKEDSE